LYGGFGARILVFWTSIFLKWSYINFLVTKDGIYRSGVNYLNIY
jgi:hypothetical protein